MADAPASDDVQLARELLAEWDEGRGASKKRLELRTWGDSTSNGRHFDRFIRTNLGIETSRPSKQTSRIEELEGQIRSLGAQPVGSPAVEWQSSLQQARASCLEALRVWNDPTSSFRTGAFSLLFVTAWNSLTLAYLQREGQEWRKLDDDGAPLIVDGAEQSLDTRDLIGRALGHDEQRGTRENLAFWIDLRNAIAHRHLPALDVSVIPWAQAGLLNTETTLVDVFGAEYALSERLSVPLQISGFRDPGVLSSLKMMQSSLPLDVQAVLARADSAPEELLTDPTYMMRVTFVPYVPNSGNSPDAVARFFRPGEVPDELQDMLDQFVVLNKPAMRLNLKASDVVAAVQSRTGHKLNWNSHADLARVQGVRPERDEPDCTLNPKYAEYVGSFKSYLYSQAWVELLVERLSAPDGIAGLTGPRTSADGADNTPTG